MQTSSSLRETRPETRAHPTKKTTGCMSGIFHLLSRHHRNRSRKRLTSAGKDKVAVSQAKSAPISEKPPPQAESGGETKDPNRGSAPGRAASSTFGDPRRSSCEAPRSPTLPPEIRRLGPAAAASPHSPRRPPALVARLMGLDEVPVSSPESAAEKRRKLLGALEKCDEDLRALKRIIEAAPLPENWRRSAAALVVISRQEQAHSGGAALRAAQKDSDERDSTMAAMSWLELNGEQPSPVSVLEALCSPRPNRTDITKLNAVSQIVSPKTTVRSTIAEWPGLGAFTSGEHPRKWRGTGQSHPFFHRIAIEGLPRMVERNEGETVECFGSSRARTGGDRGRWRRSRGRRSRAMVESVVEVWKDGVWEERWELGRVGVGLEGDIFGDLVEEVVMEMLGCYYKLPLPLRTSRKRLCF